MDKKNSKTLTIIGNLDVIVASIVLIILVTLTFFGVISRRVLGQPFTWLEEVQLACMVWIVFAAGGAAFRTGNHVAIEMVVEMFPKKVQKYFEILISLVVVAVIGYLFYQSIGFIEMFTKSGRATSMLKIPYKYIYGIAPVSYVLMIVSYFYSLFHKPSSEAEEAAEE